MSQQPHNLLSIIIPAYKQEKIIVRDINRIISVLKDIRYDWEIILVIDGAIDNTLRKVLQFKSGKVHIYRLSKNHGKGYAVRYGMKKAKGTYVLFLDAGMEIDPNGISMLMEHLEWYDADIIVGSKRHPVSVIKYPLERRILSTGYYWLVKLLFGVNVRDTQPGIKIFRRKVLNILLPLLIVKRYAFDIEIIAVAQSLGFTRIYEAPIKLNYQFGSLTNSATVKAIWQMFWDTLAVFYRLKVANYYHLTANRKKQRVSLEKRTVLNEI